MRAKFLFALVVLLACFGAEAQLSRTDVQQTTSTGGFGTGAYTPASFDPTDNALLVVECAFIAGTDDSSEGTTLTITDNTGGALSWATITATTTSPAWSYGVASWRAQLGAQGSMTISVDAGATNAEVYHCSVSTFTGHDTAAPIGATGIGSDADGDGAATCTLSGTPASSSQVFGYLFTGLSTGTGTATPGADFTEIYDTSHSGWAVFEGQVDATPTDTTVEWADILATGTAFGGGNFLCFEISQNPAALEQEGFRWGVDDANEASHTWEANQDTSITIADSQGRLLRTLVDSPGDPSATAYTLRYQKNGAGGYVAVPVGATPTSTINNQPTTASANDAQQVGTTVTINGTTIGASLDATTDWAGMRFLALTIPAGATITTAYIRVVPSATTEDEPLVTIFFEGADDCAAFTTGASNISNRSRTTANASWSNTNLGASGADYWNSPSLVTALQEVINRGGWASGNDVCVIIQGGATSTRDLTIEAYDLGPNTNPPQLYVDYTTPAEVYINTSANITAGGEATTARLTAPSGKTTGDFDTGRRWDDENGTDTLDITSNNYTEVEWLVALSGAPAASDYFDFRVYAGTTALTTYTVTPRWSIPGAGGGTQPPRSMQQFRLRR